MIKDPRNTRLFVGLFLLFAVITIIITILIWSFGPPPANAATTEQHVYSMLQHFDSPLADEVYTVVAFWREHPEFDILDFYAVMWAESSLGKGTKSNPGWRHHNVGSIKGGKVGTLWRDLRTGTYGGGYNHYDTFRDGQRAALRLILERYNGSLLRGDNLHKYYGYGVDGWTFYQADVYAARELLLHAW
jgi:hypothetical protein